MPPPAKSRRLIPAQNPPPIPVIAQKVLHAGSNAFQARLQGGKGVGETGEALCVFDVPWSQVTSDLHGFRKENT